MQSTFHRRKGARLVGRSHLSLHKPRAIRAPKAKHVLTLYFVRRRTRAGVPPPAAAAGATSACLAEALAVSPPSCLVYCLLSGVSTLSNRLT